jgi:hypothetical protein
VRRSAWLCGLILLGPSASCTLIVDADQYEFVESCARGSEGCKCTATGECEAGLQCRQPGFCVDPDSASTSADGG